MVQLTRKRTLLAKIESSYGVDPTPTGGSNAILVKNLNIRPLVAEQVSRDLIRAYLANFEQLNANTHIELDFEVEMQGSGALGTAPAYGPLLRACGMSETINASTSVVYAPISTSFESVYMYFNIDGTLHKVSGCMGTVEMSIEANQIPVFKFKFVGLYVAPSAAAAPSCTYTGFIKPLVANNTNTTPFTFYSYSAVLKSLSLNLNCQINHRARIGSEYIQFTDRKPSGQLVIDSPALGSKDFFALSVAETAGALTITHGITSGYKVKLDCASVDLGNPEYSDDDGVNMLTIPFTPLPTSGGDDFTITII